MRSYLRFRYRFRYNVLYIAVADVGLRFCRVFGAVPAMRGTIRLPRMRILAHLSVLFVAPADGRLRIGLRQRQNRRRRPRRLQHGRQHVRDAFAGRPRRPPAPLRALGRRYHPGRTPRPQKQRVLARRLSRDHRTLLAGLSGGVVVIVVVIVFIVVVVGVFVLLLLLLSLFQMLYLLLTLSLLFSLPSSTVLSLLSYICYCPRCHCCCYCYCCRFCCCGRFCCHCRCFCYFLSVMILLLLLLLGVFVVVVVDRHRYCHCHLFSYGCCFCCRCCCCCHC